MIEIANGRTKCAAIDSDSCCVIERCTLGDLLLADDMGVLTSLTFTHFLSCVTGVLRPLLLSGRCGFSYTWILNKSILQNTCFTKYLKND